MQPERPILPTRWRRGRPRSRRWGILVFRNLNGAPMLSLGVHIDMHTPRVDLHLLVWTVCIGQIKCHDAPRLETNIGYEPWSGHMDDCWCKEWE